MVCEKYSKNDRFLKTELKKKMEQLHHHLLKLTIRGILDEKAHMTLHEFRQMNYHRKTSHRNV